MRENELKVATPEPPRPGFFGRVWNGLVRNAAIAMPGWGVVPGTAPMQIGAMPPPPEGQAYTPEDLRTVVSPLQLTRLRQDIGMWRAAVAEAENAWLPHRVKMQRIFIDTVLDGHTKACVEKRRNMTRLREFEFQDPRGERNDEWTAWFQDQWFEDMLVYILDAKFFGYSLIGLGNIVDGRPEDCFIIKRWNVSPDRFNVTNLIYMPEGVPFLEEPQADWHLWVPTQNEIGARTCGYGLFYNVALYQILLRDLGGQWADYAEVYGQPTRWAQTSKLQGNPERAALENALANMAGNPYLISDLEDKLTIIESKSDNGKGGIYETLALWLTQQISKLMLGHADALESVPGKLGASQGGQVSPAQIALDEIQAVDGRFVEASVNRYLLPKLRNLGIPVPEDLRFKYVNDAELKEQRDTEDKQRKATADWVYTMFQAGIKVDPAFITEVTGVPVSELPEPELKSDDPFVVNLKSKSIQNKASK